MLYLLEFIIAIIAIGLILNFRRPVGVATQKQSLSGCFSMSFVGIYLIGMLIFIPVHPYISRSYYDYFSIDFSLGFLMFVWLFASAGWALAELIKPLSFTMKSKSRSEHFFLASCGVFLAFCGTLLVHFYLLPDLAETANGLLSKPDFASGIVENKSSSSGRGGPYHSVKIDGKNKHIPYPIWWYSIQYGDEIQYAYNPHATTSVTIIQPDQINLTIPGVLLLLVTLVFWVLTLSLWWDGIYDFLDYRF